MSYDGAMSMKDVLDALGLDDLPKAVMWDMDGTIIDSGSDWMKYSGLVVKNHGGSWTDEDGTYIFGISSQAHAEHLRKAVLRGADSAPEAGVLFDELKDYMRRQAYTHPVLLPGAGEMLAAFKAAGVLQALVTATPRDMVLELLDHLPQQYFDALSCGQDTEYGKPHPAPFILGAYRLGVTPQECIIFEDSQAGLASARASGGRTYDVASYPLASLAALLARQENKGNSLK